MLFFLKYLSSVWGPMRIFGSYAVLLCASALVSAFVVQRFLPRFFRKLPLDRGKVVKDAATGAAMNTPDAWGSVGKPTGAGRWLLLLLLPVFVLFLPPSLPGVDKTTSLPEFVAILRHIASTPSEWLSLLSPQWAAVLCMLMSMVTGYADDVAEKPWGELRKGLLDAIVALLAAAVIYYLGEAQCHTIWLPFTKTVFTVPPWAYIPGAAFLLWLSMNATNCSDGVDGLASSLSLTTLFVCAAFLYGVVGHEKIAAYLLVPHNPEGARWGILCAAVAGGYGGYLWHNAYPSRVLMGDAGSRPLGLLIGIATLASGNPLVLLAVCPIVMINGLSGLAKLSLLRLLKKFGVNTKNPFLDGGAANPKPSLLVRKLHSVRLPWHDHCRKNLGWSPTQVVIRFMLLQAFLMPILFLLLLKIR
ncbi:MAG: hypothetical protein ACOX5G_00795 [Kiritimatiellia bacterium]|jgi:phospho-N-acetylmuramoyl-pentapeptide-transferase